MNKQIILKERPKGFPEVSTWQTVESKVQDLNSEEVLIEHHFVSLDPAMRGWINEGKSYIEPVGLDQVMRAGAIGKVIKVGSNSKFKVGECLTGMGGVQQFSITDGKGWVKVDCDNVPMPKYLSVLGMTGMTAYFGMLKVGKIKKGDTVLISAAAGAVGSIAGQIAKIKDCTVIGIAGGKEKCKYLTQELNFDKAVDYKSENFDKELKEACKEGIDVYFDNVGGEILDLALTMLRKNARVVICGAISQYNNKEKVNGPNNYLSLLVNRASMTGMIVFDYADKYGEAMLHMSQWIKDGKVKSKEDIYNDIENFYPTFKRLFNGDKNGKLILKVKA